MISRSARFSSLLPAAVLAALILACSHSEASAQEYIAPQYAASPSLRAEPNMRSEVEQILALANQARAQAGVGPVRWDPALAAAALTHCRLMAREGPISHRYQGEPDLSVRAAQAGARFSLIEENVAIGPTAAEVHDEWMNSPGHRTNLLNPGIDSIGIAVIAARDTLYAVADYSRSVQNLSPAQVEQRVAALIRPTGVTILPDGTLARAACQTDNGVPRAAPGAPQPIFVMRWQDADLTQLPQALSSRLRTGNYRQAAVGSCPARNLGGSFAAYRLAVLLY